MKPRIVITGIGIVGTFTEQTDQSGESAEVAHKDSSAKRFFERLCNGDSAVEPHFDPAIKWPCAWINFKAEAHFSKMQLLGLDRTTQLALVAARRALFNAGLAHIKSLGDEASLYYGSGAGGSESTVLAHAQYNARSWEFTPVQGLQDKKLLTVPAAMMHAGAAQVGIDLGIQGECMTYSTACSSSAVALGEAFWRLRDGSGRPGAPKIALVGGAESMLQAGVLQNWGELRVLTKSQCRPFCKERDGFAMGEGAAFLVLERLEDATARHASIWAEIVGYGQSNDATHITKPDSKGQSRAMRYALKDAGIEPRRINVINVHGTGTLAGDVTEAESIHAVFEEATANIPISATKAATGHWVGAAGALEAAMTAMSLHQEKVPPMCNSAAIDESLGLNVITGQAEKLAEYEYGMSNSFAFGGNNVSLIFAKWKAQA